MSTIADFEIAFEKGEELGKGSYGTVFKATERATNRVVAVKQMRTIKFDAKQCAKREIDILKCLKNPHILEFIADFYDRKSTLIVTEYLEGGELFDRVCDEETIPEAQCCNYVRQICSGLGYLHENKIVHLDMKPENVVLTSEKSNHIKIIDFGLATILHDNQEVNVMQGTPDYVAPEVINYEPVHFKTDMWSVGVMTYLLISGVFPFGSDHEYQIFSNITKVEYDFEDESFDNASSYAINFIESLLQKRPEHRLSAQECLEHVWLQDITSINGLIRTKSLRNYITARKKLKKLRVVVQTLGAWKGHVNEQQIRRQSSSDLLQESAKVSDESLERIDSLKDNTNDSNHLTKGDDSFEDNEPPKDIPETVEELDDNNANDIPKDKTETVDTSNTDLPEPLEDCDSTYKADIIHAGGLPNDNTESDQEETNEIDKSKESSIDDDNELKNFIENFEDIKINDKDNSEIIGEKDNYDSENSSVISEEVLDEFMDENNLQENDTVDNGLTIGDATEAGTGRDSEDGSSGFQSSASSEGTRGSTSMDSYEEMYIGDIIIEEESESEHEDETSSSNSSEESTQKDENPITQLSEKEVPPINLPAIVVDNVVSPKRPSSDESQPDINKMLNKGNRKVRDINRSRTRPLPGKVASLKIVFQSGGSYERFGTALHQVRDKIIAPSSNNKPDKPQKPSMLTVHGGGASRAYSNLSQAASRISTKIDQHSTNGQYSTSGHVRESSSSEGLDTLTPLTGTRNTKPSSEGEDPDWKRATRPSLRVRQGNFSDLRSRFERGKESSLATVSETKATFQTLKEHSRLLLPTSRMNHDEAGQTNTENQNPRGGLKKSRPSMRIPEGQFNKFRDKFTSK